MISISVPSKTFLLGEYVALKGGPALILSTELRFELIATNQEHEASKSQDIHPESPAGKLIAQNPDFYQHYHMRFIDPYQGLGGFGASSAQFVMVEALKHHVQSTEIQDVELLKGYEKVAWDGKGLAPSGADIIAQRHGGLCYFHKVENKVQIFSWPFTDLDYCLIHTGNKLATHQHLKQLTTINTSYLEEIVHGGVTSLEKSDSKRFIEAINQYAQALQSQGFVAKQTQKILQHLSSNPEILAAKGCGALGSDVVLILFNRSRKKNVISWIKQKNLHVIVYGHHLAKGLEIVDLKSAISSKTV